MSGEHSRLVISDEDRRSKEYQAAASAWDGGTHAQRDTGAPGDPQRLASAREPAATTD